MFVTWNTHEKYAVILDFLNGKNCALTVTNFSRTCSKICDEKTHNRTARSYHQLCTKFTFEKSTFIFIPLLWMTPFLKTHPWARKAPPRPQTWCGRPQAPAFPQGRPATNCAWRLRESPTTDAPRARAARAPRARSARARSARGDRTIGCCALRMSGRANHCSCYGCKVNSVILNIITLYNKDMREFELMTDCLAGN